MRALIGLTIPSAGRCQSRIVRSSRPSTTCRSPLSKRTSIEPLRPRMHFHRRGARRCTARPSTRPRSSDRQDSDTRRWIESRGMASDEHTVRFGHRDHHGRGLRSRRSILRQPAAAAMSSPLPTGRRVRSCVQTRAMRRGAGCPGSRPGNCSERGSQREELSMSDPSKPPGKPATGNWQSEPRRRPQIYPGGLRIR